MSKNFGRRTLLKGLGATAASLPFLRAFPAAAADAVPKLILIGSPNSYMVGPDGDSGRGFEGWRPNGLSGTQMDLPARLPEIFRPLEAYRDQLLFIEGLSTSRLEDRSRLVPSHGACASLLTGRTSSGESDNIDDNTWSTGISVDQYIAERFGSSPLTLAFNNQPGTGIIQQYWSFRGAGPDGAVNPTLDPRRAYDDLFGAVDDTPGAGQARRARQQSILDTVAGDFRGLRSRLPAADHERLNLHLENVDRLGRELADMPDSSGCSRPARPGGYDFLDHDNLPQVIRHHSDVIVAAMGCGLRQVATLQLGFFGGKVVPNWSEFGLDTRYKDHAIAHAFNGESGAGSDGLSQSAAVDLGIKLQVAYNTLFAELVEKLASTPDVDGRPMLDNTLVIHMKQMGRANHSPYQYLHVLAGGSALGVRGGQFRVVSEGTRFPDVRYDNDLLTGICQTMGLSDVETFGTAAQNSEPIDFGA